MPDKELLDAMRSMLKEELEPIKAEVSEIKQDMDKRFDAVDKRFDAVDEKLDFLETCINTAANDTHFSINRHEKEFHHA